MVLYVSCRPGHLTGFIWNFNIPRQYEKVPSGNKETIGERKGNKIEGFYCVSPLKTNNKQTKKNFSASSSLTNCLQNRNKMFKPGSQTLFQLAPCHQSNYLALVTMSWPVLQTGDPPLTFESLISSPEWGHFLAHICCSRDHSPPLPAHPLSPLLRAALICYSPCFVHRD